MRGMALNFLHREPFLKVSYNVLACVYIIVTLCNRYKHNGWVYVLEFVHQPGASTVHACLSNNPLGAHFLVLASASDGGIIKLRVNSLTYD